MTATEPSPDRRALAEAAFDWCLRNAARMDSRGDAEHAAEWARLASWSAIKNGHPCLCSAPLEARLARLGAGIAQSAPAVARAGARPERWLHVMTWSYETGGHTAVVRRWLDRKPAREQHNVLLTAQGAETVPANLALCLERAGGKVVSLAEETTLLGRAQRLRRISEESADVVVLHVHQNDVVPALAFAAPGGPPVLLFNHADHQFWVGAAVVDLVIDFRDSGLHLTETLRGVRRSALLPLPVPDAGRAPAGRAAAAARMADPSILERRPLLLTIGDGPKYNPQPGLDFGNAALRIIKQVPECAIIAVGPKPEPWQQLHAASGGRTVAIGTDPDLGAWHAAADVYLEGFPRGSYTALLEVMLAGRAFVRKPWLAPPAELPIDRGALADFDAPPTVDAYVSAAVELCRDPALRESMAERGRAAALAAHCGERWIEALEALVGRIPARHDPQPLGAVAPLPPGLARYWDAHFAGEPADPFAPLLQKAAVRRLPGLRPPRVNAGGRVPPDS